VVSVPAAVEVQHIVRGRKDKGGLQLARQEQFFSRDSGFLDTLAHFLFVLFRRAQISTRNDTISGQIDAYLVNECTINVPVPNGEGVLDSVLDLSRFGLPCTQADGGDVSARIHAERGGEFGADGHFVRECVCCVLELGWVLVGESVPQVATKQGHKTRPQVFVPTDCGA
jgi:hypothetical protein